MNQRIRALRTALGMSGASFGEGIGVSRAAISKMEVGPNNVSERTIKLIVDKYNVNEHWLRTGEGSMFIEKTVNEELVSMIAEIAVDGDPFVVKTLTEMCKLPPESWNAIEQFIKKLQNE